MQVVAANKVGPRGSGLGFSCRLSEGSGVCELQLTKKRVVYYNATIVSSVEVLPLSTFPVCA